MITKTAGIGAHRSTYIRIEHRRYDRSRVSPSIVIAAAACCVVLALLFFFLASACEEARGQFMEGLKKEKEIVEMNKALKVELAAVTQKGYIKFAAQERLGLKEPNDKEVMVLR
jgi:DNA-binding XRE family transcriptional regulator